MSRDAGALLAAAAYRPDSNKSLSISGRPKGSRLEQFDRLAEDAQFLLGHNIIAFDIPHLRALNPHLRLLKLPVVVLAMMSAMRRDIRACFVTCFAACSNAYPTALAAAVTRSTPSNRKGRVRR